MYKRQAQHAEYVKRSQVFQKLWETADSFEADDQLNASLESCNSALTAMDFGKVTVDEVLVAKDAAGDKMGYVIVSHSDDSFTGIVKIAVGLKENGTVNVIESVSYTHLDVYKRQVNISYADVNWLWFMTQKTGGLLQTYLLYCDGSNLIQLEDQ